MQETTFPGAEACRTLRLEDRIKEQQVNDDMRCLCLTGEQIQKIKTIFREEMELGLSKDDFRRSSLQMEVTYITELPDKTEEGEYLALDLGGTNFRILYVKFVEGRVVDEKLERYVVSKKYHSCPGYELFDFLAVCIHSFLKNNDLLGVHLPIGFTFSFPLLHHGLDVGILVRWTKAFSCAGVVGQDVVEMLNDALERHGDVNARVTAILNDTTGVLVKGSYFDDHTSVGLILGTGSNVAYVEDISKVEKWEGRRDGIKKVIVNVEWGAFGDNGVLDFIKTDYDRQVDERCVHSSFHTFEKYFAGRYMGEVVRLVLIHLMRKGLIFQDEACECLEEWNSFPTSYVSEVEMDNLQCEIQRTAKILDSLGIAHTHDDILTVKHVCYVVSERGAILVGLCLSVILDRIHQDSVTIAVDGSLYKHHPRFHDLISKYIQMFSPNRKV